MMRSEQEIKELFIASRISLTLSANYEDNPKLLDRLGVMCDVLSWMLGADLEASKVYENTVKNMKEQDIEAFTKLVNRVDEDIKEIEMVVKLWR